MLVAFFKATMFTRTRLSVTLYVRCLSYFIGRAQSFLRM